MGVSAAIFFQAFALPADSLLPHRTRLIRKMPVGIKDQQHAARFQNPQPLPVYLQMFPDDVSHIPADHQVKSSIRKWQRAKIPLQKFR